MKNCKRTKLQKMSIFSKLCITCLILTITSLTLAPIVPKAQEIKGEPSPIPEPEPDPGATIGEEVFIQPYRVFEMETLNPYKNSYQGSGTGDSYSPASGNVTFSVTDISILGNSTLPVALRRWIPSDDMATGGPTGWQWDIPVIQGSYLDMDNSFTDPSTYDWGFNNWHLGQNCDGDADKVFTSKGDKIDVSTFWQGKLLHIPGATTEKFLKTAEDKQQTKSNFTISECIENASHYGGVAHQGIKVISPSGTTYTFDQIKSYYNNAQHYSSPTNRTKVFTRLLMVTLIEDKFGNKVEYVYDNYGELKTIKGMSDDTRRIDIEYETHSINGQATRRPTSASAHGRVWTFSYEAESAYGYNLNKVELPDGTTWQYSGMQHIQFDPDGSQGHYYSAYNREAGIWPGCAIGVTSWEKSATVITPEGLSIDYTFGKAIQGRANVAPAIVNQGHPYVFSSPESELPRARNLHCSISKVLARKELSGPEIATQVWEYQHSTNIGTYDDSVDIHNINFNNYLTGPFKISQPVNGYPSPITANTAQNFKTVTVIGPINKEVYYIDRLFQSPTEGAIVAQETYDLTENILQRVEFESVQDEYVGSHWYEDSGGEEGAARDSLNAALLQYRINQSKSTTTVFDSLQAVSDTYVTEYTAYNNTGALTKKLDYHGASVAAAINKRYSQYEYINDITNNVINLPTTVKMSEAATTGFKTIEETTYQSIFSNHIGLQLPWQKKQFDQLITEVKSYHNDGNLQRIEFNQGLLADSGTFRFLEFSDYFRGQARSISIPNRYNSLSQNISKTFNNFGQVTRTTDLSNTSIDYTYDDLGRLATIDPVDTKWADTKITWSMGTAPQRTIEKCTLVANSCTSTKLTNITSYDNLFRDTLSATTDNTTNDTRYVNNAYNTANQLLFTSHSSISDNEQNGTTNGYDALGRLTSTTLSGRGTQNITFLSGNKQQVSNFNGKLTTTTYLAYGAPDYRTATKIESPQAVTTDIAINVFGNTTSITQSGDGESLTESRMYDSQQRLCMTKRVDVGNSAFKYNTIGELEWSAQGVSGNNCALNGVTPEQKTRYTYDNLGDSYQVDYGDTSPDITYTTNDLAKSQSIAVGTGQQAVNHLYHYFSGGALKSEQLSIGSEKTFNLGYDYNNLGSLSSLTYPDSTLVSIANNSFGEALSVSSQSTTYANNVSFYPSGQLNSFSYGNGVVHKTTLDDISLLPSSISDKYGASKIIDLGYGYDNQANIKHITDGVDSSFSLTELLYDDLDRLTTVYGNSGIGNSSLSYGAFGNIKTYSSKDRDLTYSYTNNRLTGLTGTGLRGRSFSVSSYDSRGNVINNGKHTFSYNRANQLTSALATNQTSSANSYLYDAHNRRVKQSDAKGTSYSLYSQAGTLLYREANVVNGTGDPINYIYLGAKLIAKDGILPATGSSRQHSRPFGESIETPRDDVGYTGHKFDTDLDLSYMQARYYDPVIGRFYSNDPADIFEHISKGNIVHGFNRYKYGNNNPYKYIDPDGRFDLSVTFGNLLGDNEGANIVQTSIDSFNNDVSAKVNNGVESIGNAVDSVTPSRETAHTIGTVSAVVLTVASVTTPCTAACAGGAMAISSVQAADNLSQGKPVEAALNLLPAGSGKVVSTVYKGSAQISKSQAGAIIDAGLTAVQEIQK
jgi:RHS repeat-associated protein